MSLKTGDMAAANRYLASNAHVWNRFPGGSQTVEEFSSYASACDLEDVKVLQHIRAGQDAPVISVEIAWFCGFAREDGGYTSGDGFRRAELSVEEDEITAIAWGP